MLSHSASHMAADASEGMRQSPRGERHTGLVVWHVVSAIQMRILAEKGTPNPP